MSISTQFLSKTALYLTVNIVAPVQLYVNRTNPIIYVYKATSCLRSLLCIANELLSTRYIASLVLV